MLRRNRRKSTNRWQDKGRRNRRLFLESLETRQMLTSGIITSNYVVYEDFPNAPEDAIIERHDTEGDYSDSLHVCYEVVGTATPGVDLTLSATGCVDFPPIEGVQTEPQLIFIPYVAIDDPYYEPGMGETVTLQVTSWESSDPLKFYEISQENTYEVFDNESPPAPPRPTLPGCECGESAMSGGMGGTGVTNSGGPSGKSPSSIRYGDGTLNLVANDISSDANGIPRGITRSSTSAEGYATGSSFGIGTAIAERPTMVQIDGDDTLALIADGNTAYYFDLNGST